MAKGDVLALGAVATLLALPFTRAMTVIGAVLLLLEDFTGYLTGRDSLIGHLLGDDEDLTKSNIFGVFESLSTLLGTVFDRFVDLGQLVGEGLFGSDANFSFVETLNDFLRETIRLLDDLNVMLGGDTKAQRDYEARIESAGSLQQMDTLIKGKKDQEWYGNSYGGNLYQQLLGGVGIKGLLQGKNSVFSDNADDKGDSVLMEFLFSDLTRSVGNEIMEFGKTAINELTSQENAAQVSRDPSRRGFSPSPGLKTELAPITINFNGDNVDQEGAKKGVTEALQSQLRQTNDNLGDSG